MERPILISMTTSQRLTIRQAHRLGQLSNLGPQDTKPEVDEPLKAMGLVEDYDGEPGAVDLADGAEKRIYDEFGQIRFNLLPLEWATNGLPWAAVHGMRVYCDKRKLARDWAAQLAGIVHRYYGRSPLIMVTRIPGNPSRQEPTQWVIELDQYHFMDFPETAAKLYETARLFVNPKRR